MGKGGGTDLVEQGDGPDLVFVEEDRGEQDGFDDRGKTDAVSVIIRIEDPETLAFGLCFGTDRLIGRDRKDRILLSGIEQLDLGRGEAVKLIGGKMTPPGEVSPQMQ